MYEAISSDAKDMINTSDESPSNKSEKKKRKEKEENI
jgi:hypothetical protein